MKLRDSQRQKLYDAERECFGMNDFRLDDFDAAVKYVSAIWKSPWTKRLYPVARIYPIPWVKDGRGTRTARGGKSVINLPVWSRTKSVILHEISHALKSSSASEAAHGREFAARFLRLVEHFLGRDTGRLLKMAFRNRGVKFRPKRRLSAEQLAQLRQRGALLAAKRRENANSV